MNDFQTNSTNIPSTSSLSLSSKCWCFTCEKEFITSVTGSSEVFCPDCNGISEVIEETNDPRQFKPYDARAESNSPNLQNSNNVNSPVGPELNQQAQRRPVMSIILTERVMTPAGRITIQTVLPQSGGLQQNSQGIDPLGMLMNPFMMMRMNPLIDYNRMIEEFLRNDPNNHGAPPASQETVDRLKETKYDENSPQAKECTVCQDDYKNGESILHLPCNHSFHKACISEWLLRHNSCPVCRKPVEEQTSQQP